jgi:hypothetical protein
VCGAPLHPEQSWCLSCGAAARTRLAPAPSWKRPIGAFAVVVVLALGVLAAALVDLAGGSAPVPATTTVTVPATGAPSTATTPTTPTVASTPTTTTPSTAPGTTGSTATTPSTGTVTNTTSTPTTTTPGATGTSTTTAPKSSSAPKLNHKTKRAITKGIEEALRKAGLGKVVPGTGSPG